MVFAESEKTAIPVLSIVLSKQAQPAATTSAKRTKLRTRVRQIANRMLFAETVFAQPTNQP